MPASSHKDLLLSHPVSYRFVEANAKRFVGKMLVDVYQTSPEQTVFEWADANDEFYFITYFSGIKSFYFIKEDYGKPRSKYKTLFRSLHGATVTHLKAYEQERSIGIYFDSGDVLLLALFGAKNMIYHTQAEPSSAVSVTIKAKTVELHPATEMSTDEAFLAKLFKEEVPDVLHADFHVLADEKKHVRLDFSPSGEVLLKTSDINEALNRYAKEWFTHHGRESTLRKIETHLSKELQRLEKSSQAAFQHLERIETELDYRLWADLLMANLHNLKEGQTKAELLDFYGQKTLSIPLNKRLNPQQNAERYYRKAKNQGKEVEVLEKRIEQNEEAIEELKQWKEKLEAASDVKALKTLEKELFGTGDDKAEKESRFNEFEEQGFKIYVGRNSKNNDELTLHFAQKNDLWLHAKDLAGSHVIIRNQGSDTRYPKRVIERAAELAAYYSKGRNQQTCPVIYTEKKHIRKPKGAPAGAVLVERENILFVEPGL